MGGSVGNSAFELTWDYNGLARFLQVNGPGVQYDGGPWRLFNADLAPEAGWLILPALMGAALVLIYAWSGWSRGQQFLAVTSAAAFLTVAITLSFMGTMLHAYYTHALAPWEALTVAAALYHLREASARWAQRALACVIVGAGVYGQLRIIDYGSEWAAWVPWALGCLGTLAAIIQFAAAPPRRATQAAAAMLTVIALSAAPAASNVFTMLQPQEGTNPTSGPAKRDPMTLKSILDSVHSSPELSLEKDVGFGAPPDPGLVTLMRAASSSSTWTLATYSAQNMAQYQLASGTPVMAIGGWLGTDPAPTKDQFETLVHEGRIAYFADFAAVRDGNGQLGPQAKAIAAWVSSTFPVVLRGEPTVYDLRQRSE
ncbi:hypothetical protein [Sinomonas gamaensis]|uniref:hypothetical protein n=1 Tax=Sinomonas gamaensis TaxID=2565624 RepID=UPI0020165737|nr:hypothetical protein [Sinomonas gamaensis]